MVGAHVAHDCQVGDRVILANNATLAGHVQVGEQAIVGGLSAVRQFVRIGRNAMIGGMSGIENDVIPYGLAMGDRARLAGLNLVGLKRRGYERSAIQSTMEAYERLFEGEGTLSERVARVAQSHQALDTVRDIVEFVQADSSLGLCQPRSGNGGR
jgi:UDP-N-acetylglucosamine acyltransferase